jgi:hypothetical protein
LAQVLAVAQETQEGETQATAEQGLDSVVAGLVPMLRPVPRPQAAAREPQVAVRAPMAQEEGDVVAADPRFGFVADTERYRPDLAREDDRPIHDFLAVFGATLPLTAEEIARSGEVSRIGPVTVPQAGEAVAMEALAGEEPAMQQDWVVDATTPEDVLTLDGFIAALAQGEVDFVVPATLDLASYDPPGVSEEELVAMGLPMGPDAGIMHRMAMHERGDYPQTIRATVTETGIAMETPQVRVVVPRNTRPVSRFAVALDDTYAMPFDLTGSGQLRLQRMPVLRPEIVIGTPSELAQREVEAARFFPAPVEPLSQAPVNPNVVVDMPPVVEMGETTDDRVRDGLAQSLAAIDLTLNEEGLVDPLAGTDSRPPLVLPPAEVAPRPMAQAPVVQMPTPSNPAGLLPAPGAPAAIPLPAEESVLGNGALAEHDLRVNGQSVVPGQGSIMDRDTRRVSSERNDQMMIRLSYASEPEAVTLRVQELMRYFPQAMLDKGRFFGYAAPASPGLYIIGIQAHNAVDFQDLVAYMNNNGIPHVLPGQSAAPLLTDPLAQTR